ncbi:MAG: ribosome maturation factor RimM [Clostridiales bacterium]|nr:ribosome maturation factor RimM [Clostridiales bacterium]
MKKKYLEAGKIVSTHGIRGEVKLEPWCDSVEVLEQVLVLYLDKNGNDAIRIQSCRPHKGNAIVKLDGVHSLEMAESMRGMVLYLDRDDAPLPEGRYYIQDIIGCKVVRLDTNAAVGTVTDVSNHGAGDIYHVKQDDGNEVLIPAIAEIVKLVDLTDGLIQIQPMKGLLEDAD